MIKHTPGPWVANGCVVKAGDCYGPWVADTDVMLRYPPNKQHVSHVEQRDNARLIAAAPELLAALVEFVSAHAEYRHLCGTSARMYRAEDIARAAVAKATS